VTQAPTGRMVPLLAAGYSRCSGSDRAFFSDCLEILQVTEFRLVIVNNGCPGYSACGGHFVDRSCRKLLHSECSTKGTYTVNPCYRGEG
jgi:hypothetical protein